MSTGLLILCSPLNQILPRISTLAKVVTQHVQKTLYVQLEVDGNISHVSYQRPNQKSSADTLKTCQQLISKFYLKCFDISQTLDVRFLIASLKNPSISRLTLSRDVDLIITDCKQGSRNFKDYLQWRFENKYYSSLPVVEIADDIANGHHQQQSANDGRDFLWKSYDNVVLGGTFDRLHNGHRLLLSEAVLHCEKSLTIGVTCGPMIRGKLLWELIEPIDVRIEALRDFLSDTDGRLNYRLEPITDPFGPSTVDPELQCIVVSKETLKGGEKVNEQRAAKGLSNLDIHMIDLLNDAGRIALEEDKISSSSIRMRCLGHRRMPLYQNKEIPKFPYVIGLTGGIASGKSSICERLKKLGAATINCDVLGHQSYACGTNSYKLIVEHFGARILNPDDGSIDRKALGAIVFADPIKMQLLNSLVWPEIRRLAQQRIIEIGRTSIASVVILEAAVLLEAGWQDMVHEIWVSIIPEQEAINRLKSRNNLNEHQAKLRIAQQISNWDRVQKAAVVFSTLWEPEYTQKQVEIAWKELNEQLGKGKSLPTKL